MTDDAQREGRELVNRWARSKGYADLDAYAAAERVHWSVLYRKCSDELLQNAAVARRAQSPGAALGVTAKEYTPTPEALAAGRRALGLETTQQQTTQQEVTSE
jgi:hypothetical protein